MVPGSRVYVLNQHTKGKAGAMVENVLSHSTRHSNRNPHQTISMGLPPAWKLTSSRLRGLKENMHERVLKRKAQSIYDLISSYASNHFCIFYLLEVT